MDILTASHVGLGHKSSWPDAHCILLRRPQNDSPGKGSVYHVSNAIPLVMLFPFGIFLNLFQSEVEDDTSRVSRPIHGYRRRQEEGQWRIAIREKHACAQQPKLLEQVTTYDLFLSHIPTITSLALLSTICIGITVAYRNSPRCKQFMEHNMVLSIRNWREGRWWILLTSTLTHHHPAHLAVNIFTLWVTGYKLLYFFGPASFFSIWALGGITGGVVQLWRMGALSRGRCRTIVVAGRTLHLCEFDPQEEDFTLIGRNRWAKTQLHRMGLSGSLCAMLGVNACLSPARELITALAVAIPSIACLEKGWLRMGGHEAHLGGLRAGVLYYFAVLRRAPITKILKRLGLGPL